MSSELPAISEAGSPSLSRHGAGADLAPFGPALDAAAGPSAAQQVERAVSALIRYKWIILLVTVLGTAAGAVASRFSKPHYTAQSTLWVEVRDGSSTSQGPIRTGQLLQSYAWLDLLKTYIVLDYVVREQQLFVEPKVAADSAAFASFGLLERFQPGRYTLAVSSDGRSYVLSTDAGIEVERGQVGSPVGRRLGFDWTPTAQTLRPGRTIDFNVMIPRDVAVRLANDLQSTMKAEGNFLRLSLSGTDPVRATSTLNAIAERYVHVAADLKRTKLDELTTVLDEQRQYAEENLRDAESDLQNYRINTITLPSDQTTALAPGLQITQDPVLSQFFDLRVSLEQLRHDREAIDRVLAEAKSSDLSLDALMMIPSAAAAPELKQALDDRMKKRVELRNLQQRYTDSYQPLRQVVENIQTLERETIPRLAMELRAQIVDREKEIDSRIASASGELRQIPPRAIEEARLKRRVAIADNLHTTLKQRFEEARLAAASTIPDIRVLDKAVVPNSPTSDSGWTLIVMGLLGGLGVSVAGIVLLDRFDPRVRYPQEVTSQLGLSILGLVPSLREVAGKGANAAMRASEAFREIRLRLMYAHGTAGPLLVTITSPESGDGKSFMTTNLALSFADQGHRTLIIDGDIRRGAIHRALGGRRTPGLTDFLAGDVSAESIVQETKFPSVFMIGAGTRMQNGPELLGSRAMSELVLKLRSQFGVILIDSPPLGAGVDAFVLGTHTRNMLVVLRTGTTHRAFAEAKLEILDRLPIRVLGAVLNGVPDSKVYRYYSYLPGYELEPEEATGTSVTTVTA